MKKLILTLLFLTTLFSCADSKTLNIDGVDTYVEPYGWADSSIKNDKVAYEVNVGNVVWSILLSETIIVPVWLTGYQILEPVRVK